MEIASRPQEKENPSSSNSPNSNGSCTKNNSSLQVPTPPVTPQPISRSEAGPYPTTFVQADTTTFKQVVQLLTGSSETAKQASKPDPPLPTNASTNNNISNNRGCSIPPIRTGQKKQGFKLYERRNSLKNGLMISPLISGFPQNGNTTASFSPRKSEILSPSILDFPSLVISPVTPLNHEEPFNKSSPSLGNSSEEEKAIAEKKFYLHPSPRTASKDSPPPQLLPLFPVTSSRVSGSSS